MFFLIKLTRYKGTLEVADYGDLVGDGHATAAAAADEGANEVGAVQWNHITEEDLPLPLVNPAYSGMGLYRAGKPDGSQHYFGVAKVEKPVPVGQFGSFSFID